MSQLFDVLKIHVLASLVMNSRCILGCQSWPTYNLQPTLLALARSKSCVFLFRNFHGIRLAFFGIQISNRAKCRRRDVQRFMKFVMRRSQWYQRHQETSKKQLDELIIFKTCCFRHSHCHWFSLPAVFLFSKHQWALEKLIRKDSRVMVGAALKDIKLGKIGSLNRKSQKKLMKHI